MKSDGRGRAQSPWAPAVAFHHESDHDRVAGARSLCPAAQGRSLFGAGL
jgi:hypothetical protein